MGETEQTIQSKMNYVPQAECFEDEIDLLELWLTIWKRRKFIAYFVSAMTIATVIISLLMPNIYRSEFVILPSGVQESGVPSGLSGLANIAGISLPASPNSAEIKERLKSKALYARIIQKYNLMPILFEDEWDEAKRTWKDPEDHPTIEDGIRKFTKKIVHISEDQKTGSIKVSVDFKDPEMAAYIANLIIKELRSMMSSDAIKKAQNTLRELKKALKKATDPLVQQKIYNLMAQQIETIAVARATENFAFNVIDPPRVPDKKYKPKRALMVIVAFISSIFLSVLLVFFLEYIENAKKRLREEGTIDDAQVQKA